MVRPEGVKAPLLNLGNYGSKLDDAETQELAEALARFQEEHPR
jgi:hypothetical protein